MVKSGRYASYWNAFLFYTLFASQTFGAGELSLSSSKITFETSGMGNFYNFLLYTELRMRIEYGRLNKVLYTEFYFTLEILDYIMVITLVNDQFARKYKPISKLMNGSQILN